MRRRRGAFAATAFLCALAAARASGDVIYVRAGATGSNNGSTWSNAFTSLQSALSVASSGDQIWVAAGTYKPSPAADRGLSFALVDGVGIYGGFAGGEATLGERDPAVNLTVLSGDIGTAGNPADNSYHVVRAGAAVTSSAVLDGFTITAGRADGAFPDNRGGGISCEGGSPTFSMLILSANHAADRGGAVRVDSGSPSFSECAFLSNSAGSFGGGGLSAGVVGVLAVSRCRFQGNTVGNSTGGGAIHTSNGTALSNSLVTGSSPHAIVFAQQSNSLTNCTVAGNAGYGVTFVDVNNTVRSSILYGNSLGEINPFFQDAAIEYSDVQGGHAGTGNIDANPLFANAGGGDFRLTEDSPAVDAGDPAPPAAPLDLDGQPRVFNSRVDMGAYEWRPVLSVSDPASQSVCVGSPASFSVTASGQPPLSYQWRRNGTPLSDGGGVSGAETAALSIDPAAAGHAGSYDVQVTDGFAETVTSAAASLAVNPIPGTPVITAPLSIAVGATGVVASVANNPASTYAWTVTGGTLTGGQGTNQITFSAGPPGTTMTLLVVETAAGCSSPAGNRKAQVDFGDVPPSNPFRESVNTIARNGITSGCGGGNYCPASSVTRAQMAIFLLRGKHGGSYSPPPATGTVFGDVPAGAFAASWIEQLAAEGITSGCGGGNYCPGDEVTRAQMALFLLKAKHGSAYTPPPATGVFSDVPVSHPFARWIEQLAEEAITSGCGGGNYCPSSPNTRGQMAVFLRKTFGLE